MKYKHTFNADEKWGKLSGPVSCDAMDSKGNTCGQPVWYRDKRVSKNNVRIRLGPSGIRVHRCKFNPYNWTKPGKVAHAETIAEIGLGTTAAAADVLIEQQRRRAPTYTIEYFELLQRIERLETQNSRVVQTLNNLFQRLRLLGEFLPL